MMCFLELDACVVELLPPLDGGGVNVFITEPPRPLGDGLAGVGEELSKVFELVEDVSVVVPELGKMSDDSGCNVP